MARTNWREFKRMAKERSDSLAEKIERLNGTRMVWHDLGGTLWKLHAESNEDESVVFVGDSWEELYYQIRKADELMTMLLVQNGTFSYREEVEGGIPYRVLVDNERG